MHETVPAGIGAPRDRGRVPAGQYGDGVRRERRQQLLAQPAIQWRQPFGGVDQQQQPADSADRLPRVLRRVDSRIGWRSRRGTPRRSAAARAHRGGRRGAPGRGPDRRTVRAASSCPTPPGPKTNRTAPSRVPSSRARRAATSSARPTNSRRRCAATRSAIVPGTPTSALVERCLTYTCDTSQDSWRFSSAAGIRLARLSSAASASSMTAKWAGTGPKPVSKLAIWAPYRSKPRHHGGPCP